jgi:hypothetical protein
MNHIVMHCPEQGLDKFEEISFLLKQQKDGKIASLGEFLRVSEERPYCRPGKDESSVKYLNKAKKFFDVSIYIFMPLIKPTVYRSKAVLQLRVVQRAQLKVMVAQMPEVLQDPLATCPTSLQTHACISGRALASETTRHFSWPSHSSN